MESGNYESHPCTSCLDNFKSMEVLLVSCKKHYWCKDCLLAYFQSSFRDMAIFPPRCCDERIKLRDVLTFLPNEVQKLYSDKWIEYNTPDKEKTYCSNAKCSIFLFPEDLSGDKGTCPKCLTLACIKCKGKYHLGKCTNNYDEDLQKVLKLADRKGWQTCPKCGHVVEKTRGCDHIYCRCGCDFCYKCGAEWDRRAGDCVKGCDLRRGPGRVESRDGFEHTFTARPALAQASKTNRLPQSRLMPPISYGSSYLHAPRSQSHMPVGYNSNINQNQRVHLVPDLSQLMGFSKIVKEDKYHGQDHQHQSWKHQTQPYQDFTNRQNALFSYYPPTLLLPQPHSFEPHSTKMPTRRQPIGSLRRRNFNDTNMHAISQSQYFEKDIEDEILFQQEWNEWERLKRR